MLCNPASGADSDIGVCVGSVSSLWWDQASLTPGGKAADDLIFFVDLPSPDLSPDLLGDYLPNTGLELEYCLRLHFWEGAQSKTVVIFHFLSPCRI